MVDTGQKLTATSHKFTSKSVSFVGFSGPITFRTDDYHIEALLIALSNIQPPPKAR